MRILSVAGSQEQLDASPLLSLALRERGVTEVVFNAGPPDDSDTDGEETGRLLPAIEAAVLAEQPDAVLVFGDGNSTLAGALAAAKLLVPVVHVGAGLRSHDRRSPEELNCALVDRLADLLFCPTETAVANLAAEGITEGVHLVGDVAGDPKAAAKAADLLTTMSSDE